MSNQTWSVKMCCLIIRTGVFMCARGVFQLEICEEIQAFSRNHFANFPRKVGGSLGQLFAPFLYTCSTIMGVAIWERDFW